MSSLPLPKPPVWVLACLAIVTISGAFFLLSGERYGQHGEERMGAEAGEHGGGFHDVALESGLTFKMAFLPNEQGERFKINLYDHGCGVAVGDFDGDGFDDIYFVNQLGKNALYRNKGDGTFEDVTEQAGVGLGDRVCVAATWADFDNDGNQDLFVTSTRGGNVLFKNLGNGRFKDVTKEAGVEHIGHSQTAVFFDYDNDGYLDLLVTNTAKWTQDRYDAVGRYYSGRAKLAEMADSPKEYNILYHNNGDGTFTDVTAKSGLKGQGWSGDVAVFDYDEDGWLDVLVTNMFGRSQLYRNNANGTFTDVTEQTLQRTSWGAIGAKVFDFNNDGRFDLFIVDMHSDMWSGTQTMPPGGFENRKWRCLMGPDPEVFEFKRQTEVEMADRFQIEYNQVVFGNTLHKNLGNGRFEEVSDAAGMETWWPWGIVTGDFDNDGFEDVFIPSGMGYPYFYWRNYLMMNNGDETFTDQSLTAGIEPPVHGVYLPEKIGKKLATRSSRCAAVADFDGDGRLDIITNNFNDHPYYFRNHHPRKNYVAFKLQGRQSNRDAIGAVVRLYTGKEVMARQVNPAGGYLSQSSKTLHFGLGDRDHIDHIEIKWPSGKTQKIERPAANRLHEVFEPN